LINAPGASGFHGTLAFATNSTERMRIDSAGNVGIGTSNPLYKLDTQVGAGAQNIFRAGQTGVSNGFVVASDGTSFTYLFNSGNVGIGTSSPGALLDVAANSTTAGGKLRLSNLNTNITIGGTSGEIEFYNADATVGAGISGFIKNLTTDAGRNYSLTFGTGDSATIAERLRIDSAGNVGIGTSSPTDSIHITRAAGSGITFTRTGAPASVARISNASDLLNIESTNVGVRFLTGATPAERLRIDSAGNVGIGTSSPAGPLHVVGSVDQIRAGNGTVTSFFGGSGSDGYTGTLTNHPYTFYTNSTERARIDSSGNLLVGKTAAGYTSVGGQVMANGQGYFTASGADVLAINRLASDGTLVGFYQANTQEGSISVSGTTVSYNGGHLSRWAQTLTAKDESLVKGTVLSNLDEMNVYTDADGNPVENEQLNKVKVSDVEGDANVAGVFVNWEHDEDHNVDEINMAMTGDMIIRIAQGVTVQRGDLLMSAGDGTAKPQGDDIVRAKTIAKVTSTHVTCTYADGSFCVPCVLMAC
jgi:hypothetical protein